MSEHQSFNDQLRTLGQRMGDLLIDIARTDEEIRDVKQRHGRAAAASLGQIKNRLIQDYRDTKREYGEVAAGKSRAIRSRSLELLGNISSAEALRSIAKRVGVLEQMYVTLANNMDEPFEDFDWRIPVRKAMKQLGERD